MSSIPPQIPPGMVRLSVMFGPWLLVSELDVDALGMRLKAFEVYAASRIDLAELRGTVRGYEAASSIAAWAAALRDEPGMVHTACVSALWMALNHYNPSIAIETRDTMRKLILEDDGVWFTGVTDAHGIEWTFAALPVSMARHGEAAMPWLRHPDHGTVH